MSIEDQIREMAARYAENLRVVTEQRVREMEDDDTSHFLIYRVLGVSDAAWTYIRDRTGIDLKAILEVLAMENTNKNVN